MDMASMEGNHWLQKVRRSAFSAMGQSPFQSNLILIGRQEKLLHIYVFFMGLSSVTPRVPWDN